MGTEETKKYDDRFRVVVAMGLFILFVFIWSSCVSIVGVRAAKDNGKGSKTAETEKKGSGEKDDEKKEITPDALGELLLEGVDFSAKLTKATDSMASNLVIVSDNSKLQIYMASGSYADEIIIIKAADNEAAENDKAAVEQHIRDKRSEFEKYKADEVKKLDNAYIVCKDSYVISCVSNNAEQAEKIVMEALK